MKNEVWIIVPILLDWREPLNLTKFEFFGIIHDLVVSGLLCSYKTISLLISCIANLNNATQQHCLAAT